LSFELAERFSARLIDVSGDDPPSLNLICRVCCDLLHVSLASMVLTGKRGIEGVTGASDAVATAIQDQEFTLGEGPATDAHRQGRPILVADLRDASGEWPQFVAAVAHLPVRGLFAIPLREGVAVLGVLVLCRADPGPLVDEELSDALVVANLVGRLVLALQADLISDGLVRILDPTDSRAVVHQATGMIAAQLNVSVAEALVRLRANAFATDDAIDEVARAVVAGQRRFEER
jgi:hypothetical protein